MENRCGEKHKFQKLFYIVKKKKILERVWVLADMLKILKT
jgi:hypothetical protein